MSIKDMVGQLIKILDNDLGGILYGKRVQPI